MRARAKTYSITKIADFFVVPAHRRALMLHEFGLWMDMHDRIGDLANDPDCPPGLAVTAQRDAFHWIDDDRGEAILNIRAVAPLKPGENA